MTDAEVGGSRAISGRSSGSAETASWAATAERGVRRVEALPRSPGGAQSACSRVRGPALGRRWSPRLHRPPCRVGERCALLVVGTARSELLDRRPGWTESREHAVTLSLSPLSDEETVTLVGALLEDALLTPRAESALLARAAGNPLYAGEYARMLIDRGSAGHAGLRPRRAMTSPCPRRSRESSPPASTPSLLGKRRSCRTPPSSAGRSGQAR